MSVENTIREVVPEDWDVIPKSSLDDIELRLALCTGFIAYSLTDKNAPYLIVHSGSTQMGGILPVLAMFEVMNSRNFRSHTKDINQMSLNEILDHYKRQFMEQYDEEIDARLGIYIFSGCRVNPTDLAILRHFLLDENSNLMGAELNQSMKVRLKPSQGLIQILHPVNETEIIPPYQIGSKHQINLRT